MDFNGISLVVAAAVAFVVGGLWYSPLFGKAWMAEQPHRKKSDYKNSWLGMGVHALYLLVSGYIVFIFAQGTAQLTDATTGALVAFLVLGVWTALGMISGGIFLGQSKKLLAINVGQQLLMLAIFAVATLF